jgi:hypothetical protein
VPPSADYAVEAVLARKTAVTRNIYLCVRCSADGNTYYAFYYQRDGTVFLRKTIDGGSTTLSEVVRAIPENSSETWRIAIEGSRILCTIDGATIFDVTDTAISSGFVGLHFYTYPYDSSLDGTVVESFMAETLAAPVNHTVTIAGVRVPRAAHIGAGGASFAASVSTGAPRRVAGITVGGAQYAAGVAGASTVQTGTVVANNGAQYTLGVTGLRAGRVGVITAANGAQYGVELGAARVRRGFACTVAVATDPLPPLVAAVAGVRRPRTGAVVAGMVPLRAVDFKATVGADVIDTFLNTLEFADTHTINGAQMPAVVDSPVFAERQARSQKDYADGIYTDRKIVYVSAAAFGVRPALGEQLMLDGARFIVTECTDEMGMYAITVEASEF